MEPNATTVIKNQLSFLPNEVKAVLHGDRIENSSFAIAQIYELTEVQREALELELMLTFLGLEFISTIETRLETELGIDKEKTQDILDSLSSMIFDVPTLTLLASLEQSAPEGDDKGAAGTLEEPEKTAIPTSGVKDLTLEETKAEATGKAVSLNDKKNKAIKEQAEREAKGIRTMRDDVNRLRGGDSSEATPGTPGSNFTKPFKGN